MTQKLQYIAQKIIKILQLESQDEEIDLLKPNLLIMVLKNLFPNDKNQWEDEVEQMDEQEKWSVVIQYVGNKMLEEDIPFEEIGVDQIQTIYQIVLDYIQQKAMYLREMEKQDILQSKKLKSNQKLIKKNSKKNKSNSKNKSGTAKNIDSKQRQINTKKIIEQIQPKSKKVGKIIKSKSQIQKPKPKQKQNVQQPLQNEILRNIKKQVGKKPLSKPYMKEPQSTEMLKKNKRRFQYMLKEMKRQAKKKHKLKQQLKIRQPHQVDQYYLKFIAHKHKLLEERILDEQLKYYMSLKSKKVNFIKNIHKLTEQLEKQRQIDVQKKNRQVFTSQRKKTQLKVEQAENLFQQNMEMLREMHNKKRKQNQMSKYNEKDICKQLQRQVLLKKQKQMEEMRLLWKQESDKLKDIVGDEQKMKHKLVDIYRKNRV